MGFQAGYDAAGLRGHAYLVHRNYLGAPAFTSQYRAVEKGAGDDINCSEPVSIVSDLRINYCPTCGANLAKFYAKRIDELYRSGFLLSEDWPPAD